MSAIDHNKIHTIVVKFERDTPAYHAGMEILGGKIQSVQFDDALLNLENAEEHIAALQARVAELEKRVATRGDFCRSLVAAKQQVEKERDGLAAKCAELETELVGQRHKFDVLMSISAPTEKDASALLAKIKADAVREALTNPKPTNCWKCSDEYEIKLAECPHCGAANANVNWDLAKDQIEREGGV